MKRKTNTQVTHSEFELASKGQDGSPLGGPGERPSQRPMADLGTCKESLDLLKKMHRPSLFRVMELVTRSSD